MVVIQEGSLRFATFRKLVFATLILVSPFGVTPQGSCNPFAHIAHYVRYPPKGWGANGESEGKAPQGPAPLRAAQRN